MAIKLETPLSELHGVGPQFLAKLKKLNHIKTVRDLLYHFPSRYEDWSEIARIADLKIGEEKTIQAEVREINVKPLFKRRMTIIEATLADESGEIQAIWFNQPYITKTLRPGTRANFAGKLAVRGKDVQLSNPAYELVGRGETKHTGRLVPIYPETKGLTSKGIRYLIKPSLDELSEVQDFMPQEILEKNNLPELNDALQAIHFPKNIAEAEHAKKRFSFEEIFLLQTRNLLQKLALKREHASEIKSTPEEIDKILASLPFELTETQKKSLLEILNDLAKDEPMNRLLQGDVGSGKTVVVGVAAMVVGNNYQVAIMAPTEILARQHYKTFVKLFSKFDGGIALMLSKESRVHYSAELENKITKPELIKNIERGNIKIVIGTHALIQKGVKFKELALIVVDEQHRFGVDQRAELTRRGGLIPHFLSMSATPIPRTLMFTIFGDLDLSHISELPKGRKQIITKVVEPSNRDKAYAFIRGQVRKGDQVFVVCPRIEPPKDEESGATTMDFKALLMLDMKNVTEEYEKLAKKVFPDLRVAMLHGKLNAAEKEKVMAEFAAHKTDILVTTSVIEVGVDIPNATIMIIEGAERFGLAQLYQFRGRVGRGDKQSFCFLFTESKSEKAASRLKALITAKNGFELAEYDLKFRGPGEFLGDTQTGLPDFAMRALQNPELITNTRTAAEETLKADPDLKTHPLLHKKLEDFQKEIHLE